MYKKLLEEKLQEIDITIKSQYFKENELGVLGGLSGIALFQFYFSKYLNDENHKDVGSEILTLCISKINNGYRSSFYSSGIAGFGWVLDHLAQEGFIEIETDELLTEFDDYIYSVMISDLKDINYDFLYGAIGYAYYFLSRYKNTKQNKLKSKYEEILLEFIELLQSFSEKEGENKIKWLFKSAHDLKKDKYNLSLSHGIASIIGFLTKLHKHDVFSVKTEPLLKKAINYLISYKNKDEKSFSLFPNSISDNDKIIYQSRLAWCYGDLGIGIALYNASKELYDKELEYISIEVLKHATKRKTHKNTWIKKATICHGSFGVAQIFNRIYKETGLQVFKETSEYWIQVGIDLIDTENKHTIYKQWKNKNDKPIVDLSLIEGLTGIGLVIIDFLADFDSNWDECLMIS